MRASVAILSQRASRQVMLAVAVLGGLGVVRALLQSDDGLFVWSMATAYVSLALLIGAVAIGPWRVLHGHRPAVNSSLRRDLGIWGGVLGVIHAVVGLQVHFRGTPAMYFLPPLEERGAVPIRTDLFGFANYTGAAATLLVLVLLALSNDRSLRRLGPARWKRWQRLTYALMALVLAHGAAYQLSERRGGGFVLLMLLLTVSGVALQVAGARRVRASVAAAARRPAARPSSDAP